MEEVRLEVVNKKRVENPKKLHDFKEEIILLTRNITETKSLFLFYLLSSFRCPYIVTIYNTIDNL